MRRIVICCAALALLASPARAAEAVGVSMGLLGNNLFQTLIRDGMDREAARKGAALQVEDAGGDVNRQLDQVRNFLASGVRAVVVDPADSTAGPEMSRLAAAARVPLVFVNIAPDNLAALPAGQSFVGSDERESGTMQMREVCRLLGGRGRVAVMVGDLTTDTARQRTADVYDVVKAAPCSGMEVVDARVANWSRIDGADLVANWMTSGAAIDAIVANNDEMALGAVRALKDAGRAGKVVVAGIDATPDGLKALADGDIAATVFQDADGQGRGAIDAALALARGEAVPRQVMIPFRLVTRANIGEFSGRN